MKRLIACIFAATALPLGLAAFAQSAGVESENNTMRATGFRPPSRGTAARRVDNAGKGLLRGSLRTVLPARWDSRDQGWISPAGDQGNVGTCWTFATFAIIEAQLLKSGRGLYDFSERNLVNLNGWSVLGPDDGGNFNVSSGYLLRWAGPVAETNDVYNQMSIDTWTTDSPHLPPVMRVQNVVWLEPLDGTTERISALKSAIMEYGAIGLSMGYYGSYEKTVVDEHTGRQTKSHYCHVGKQRNHAVTLIGWDDNFPSNSFVRTAPGNGAWIVKNSWGANWGDGGCFRVSYYDKMFGRVDPGTVFILGSADEDYDAVHCHDREGPIFDASSPESVVYSRHDLQAAVFTAAWNERLEAVGVWTTLFPHPCEISIYTNVTRGAATPIAGGVLACRQSFTLEHAGFSTIHLSTPVPLADGTGFAVVYRQTGTNLSNHVNSHDPDWAIPVHRSGTSYFGYYREEGGIEGSTWFDGKTILEDDPDGVDPYDVSWASTIKAYTRSTIPVRDGDAPAETDDGTEYLADLAVTNAVLFSETAETFGASANLVGANGRSLWTSWLAGFNPSNPADSELIAGISVTNDGPRITWTPDLGANRTYVVWGIDALGGTNEWRAVDSAAPGATGARFFRVSVGPRR